MAVITKEKLGLHRGRVSLKKHDPYWSVLYVQEAALISKIFEEKLLSIDHIGSTAVRHLKAKPIIDMQAELDNLDLSLQILRRLKAKGYVERPNPDFKRLFVKGPEENRTHHLHLYKKSNKHIRETILFRDRLRADQKLAQAYEKLKTDLAKKHKNNRDLYTEGKTAFIKKAVK